MLRGDLDGPELERHVEEGGSHHHARQGGRLGARQLALPPDLRAGLLRDRVHDDRRRAGRHRALRLRGVPRLAAPGRPADPLGPRVDQDGADRPAHLRPDARAEVGDLDGRLLLLDGRVQQLRLVPADKFMPVDVHVPGCPPRPEALMHGVLKLRDDDPGRTPTRAGASVTAPSARRKWWARRPSTPINVFGPGTPRVPDATGLELIAQELREATPTRSSTPCSSATARR